jgi:hypothetical protein
MITTLIIALFIELKWSPRLEYIKESEVLILHYNVKFSREYFVVWKF